MLNAKLSVNSLEYTIRIVAQVAQRVIASIIWSRSAAPGSGKQPLAVNDFVAAGSN